MCDWAPLLPEGCIAGSVAPPDLRCANHCSPCILELYFLGVSEAWDSMHDEFVQRGIAGTSHVLWECRPFACYHGHVFSWKSTIKNHRGTLYLTQHICFEVGLCTGSTKLKKCSGGAPNIFLTSYFFNPKPNPYPFLDPGRVIPGNAGGPGPRRRAGSQNANPLGGCAPQTPARVSSGRSGAQRHIFVIVLFY